ncbi:MAG: hypothetical protein HZA53_05710 [Planctomycetes bacterium]|nr:hypothetical protein [Planctomycetota bacterium]
MHHCGNTGAGPSLRRGASIALGLASITFVAHAQLRFEHLATVDLSALTLPTSATFTGTQAANVAWNGSELVIAGWNAGMATTVGIVRITDVFDTPVISAPFGVVSVVSGLGYSGLDVQGAMVAAPLDTGATSAQGLALYDASGAVVWSFSARCTSGAAFDPDFLGAHGPGSGVGWVSFAGGRRALNDAATGAEIYSLATGMIINSSSGTTWRDLDFDETNGDVYLRKSNDVVRCVRTGSNDCVSTVLVNLIDSTQPRQNVAVLNADGGTYLLFNDRFTNATGQSFFTVNKVTDTSGVAVATNFGSFAPPTSNGAYDFGWDSGTDTLAVLDVSNVKAYLFQLLTDPQDGSFCYGDGLDTSHTTPCPCANVGSAGRGCANSVHPEGARLLATGSAAADDVVLRAQGMPATVACIYLQGDAQDDVVFGDGVRCAGGSLLRLRTKLNVGGASSFPEALVDTITLSARGGVSVGSGLVRFYQTYYRNSAAAFCPPETFNVSKGWLQVC